MHCSYRIIHSTRAHLEKQKLKSLKCFFIICCGEAADMTSKILQRLRSDKSCTSDLVSCVEVYHYHYPRL